MILLKSQQHLVPCGLQDDACETDSITDWMVNGKQQYTIVRKCHSKSRDTPEIGTTECRQGQTPVIQFKDCFNICEGEGSVLEILDVSRFSESP